MFSKQISPVTSNFREEVIIKLQDIIDAEHSSATCYRHLTDLIKNGRIKQQFNLSAQRAQANKEELISYLNKIGVNDFVLEETCTFCKIDPEWLSLAGAIDLGLQIDDTAIKLYKELLILLPEKEEKEWLKAQLKEKMRQRDLLKKEKAFDHGPTGINLLNEFCMTCLMSRTKE